MIIGTLYNGGNCVYDLPIEIKTAAEPDIPCNISWLGFVQSYK